MRPRERYQRPFGLTLPTLLFAARVGQADYSKLVNPLERSIGSRSPSQAVGQGTLKSK